MSTGYGRLKRKAALITGAGSGIGYAMTTLFAAEGAQVAAIAHRASGMHKLAKLENVFPILADVTKLEDINRMVEEAQRQFGKLDILCNVAGVHDLCHPLDETSDDLWEQVLDTDLTAPFRISRRVIKSMIERQSGVILNIGSLTANRGIHGPSYCAAKAGVIGMTLSIAVAYATRGIRCNAINPGPVRTEIGANSGIAPHVEGYARAWSILGGMPVPQICEPEEIASVALFLCSDESKHVNGAVVAVDGGMSAC